MAVDPLKQYVVVKPEVKPTSNISGFGTPNPFTAEENKKWGTGYRVTSPQYLYDVYNKIAQQGIYGQSGISGIMGSMNKASALRRRALARGMTQKYGRRLGPRSGAIGTMIANKVQAPESIAMNETLAGLEKENLSSRLTGVKGMQSVLDFLENRYNMSTYGKQGETDSGGLLDYLGPAGDIASLISSLF